MPGVIAARRKQFRWPEAWELREVLAECRVPLGVPALPIECYGLSIYRESWQNWLLYASAQERNMKGLRW